MLAAFVAFATILEFFMITMFMGGIPIAEHDSLEPRIIGAIGADHGNTTLGETKKRNQMR